jgi:hypothetical protein
MRDPKTEAFLNRGQWQWRYEPDVTFDQIDITYSTDNPARLNRKIDDDRVLQYAGEMQDGVQFPAIVLLSPSDRGIVAFDVATGMHRLNAADLAQTKLPKKIDGYVITEADRYRRETLTRRLNTIEGRGADSTEQIMHIIYLHEHYKQSIASLCKEWHVKEHTVRTHLRAEQARKRARQFGFNLDRSKLSLNMLGVLQTNLHSDRVFGDVVQFILHHGPPNSTIDDICKSVKDIRDEAQALSVVQTYVKGEEERQSRERAKIARTQSGPAQKMISNAGRFNRQIQQGIDRLFLSSLTEPDKKKARALLDDLVGNAKRVLSELDRIDQINAGTLVAA